MTRNKIGILIENRFIDREIIYYSNRFEEEGYETVFLTRLWGNEQLTFKGLELGMTIEVDHSFEDLDEEALRSYGAIIVPAGYVADYLLYSQVPKEPSPAVRFVERVMGDKEIIKGFICHSLWIAGPARSTFEGRKATCHNNIISHAEHAGIVYMDKDIYVDGDLVSARTGDHFAPFAREVIEIMKK